MISVAMRDIFWDNIYELAKNDKDIVIVSADFGAPSLDRFRADFPNQYINVGISEQNAILVATGLALEGKKPLVYAISQFITLRCFEQIRIYPCGMNLPITIVGVGAGACYWESGSTHHCIEQLSVMRTLPYLKIYNCSDGKMAGELAKIAIDQKGPKYIQLEREVVNSLYEKKELSLEKGIYNFENGDNYVFTTGVMVKELMEIREQVKEEIPFSIVDVFCIPQSKEAILEILRTAKTIVTVEENVLSGGMGSYILEIAADNGIELPMKRVGIDLTNGYDGSYNYGGREDIRSGYGMGREKIIQVLNKYFKK